MNESNSPSAQKPDDRFVADASPINPSLGAALGDDYDILQDDLRQVNDAAAGLNDELAGKSKQLKHLSFLIEQAKAHLGHMRDSIDAMRKERHKLANTVLGAPVIQQMLSRATAERDQLRGELNRILAGQALDDSQKALKELRFDKRDQQIAELTFELVTLRQQTAEFRRATPPPAPIASQPPPGPPSATTPAKNDKRAEIHLEIVPTERVAGSRTAA